MLAAYLRVSSRGQNAATQRHAITKAARARGLRIGVWFSEKIGGARARRPELERLRAAVRAGEFEGVFVYRLNRLSRVGIPDTLSIVDEFRRHNCRIESVADGFPLTGPGSQIVLAVFAGLAQIERERLNENLAAARQRLEASGRSWGRPARVDKSDRAKILAMGKRGRTVRAISMAVKVPKSTICNILSKKGPYKTAVPAPPKKPKSRGARPLSK